ncbi:hypothetical protein D3C81_1977950 [compost metagenome]
MLVRRQAGEGEQRQGDVVGALRRQKVAMVLAAELFHQGNPHLAVVLESVELVGVEHVFQVASDHFFVP